MTPTVAAAGVPSLSRLARLYGIQTSHFSNRRRVTPGPEAVIGALRALGADVPSPSGVSEAIRERERQLETRVVEPVHVFWDGVPARVPLRASAAVTECSLRLESGETSEWRAPADGPVSLPPLPFGYHRLTVRSGAAEHQSLVISAPSRAYAPDERKMWGAFLPLYALSSRDGWGAGDFAGLRRLAAFTGRLGASLMATLPIMSAFLDEPFNPSPYAPASRLFWNELYIDIEGIPELQNCPQARDLIASPEFQRDLARLRLAPLVDYRNVMRLKRSVFSYLAAALSGPRLEAFQCFVREQPVLQDYARFRAACEHYRLSWREWPDRARSGSLDGAALDPEAVRYHEYVQWIAHEQLADLVNSAARGGVSLYLDLPLGASRDSYDAWRHRSIFAERATVGAPPDALFPQGQDWGFPPPHPEALRADGYAHFVAVVRRLLALCGVLRIDHVMGLHRLYWVPQGMSATHGVYVHYRPDEIYAILCLESHRHRTAMVGEDLGTVPPYVEASMARHNIYRMYVLQYEVSSAGPVRPAPKRAAAGLNTHDTPPFAAWRDGADIDGSARLGFLDAGAARDARANRLAQREALSRFLQARGLTPAAPSPRDLVRGALRHLAGSRSRMMLVNLEDLWLETRPQNIPGTTDNHHPNWRRKAARTLEDIERDPEIGAALREVNSARTTGSAR